MIDDKKAVSIDRQGLVFRNQPLSDFATLDAIGVRDGAVIHLIMQGNAAPAPAPASPSLVRTLSGRERQAAAAARQQEHAAQAAAAQAERELAEAQRLIAEHRRAEEVRKID